MERRLKLHQILKSIKGPKEVYYQPPETLKLDYPCIIYEWASKQDRFADNKRYKEHKRYTVTIIDHNPDSSIPGRLEELEYCSFDRSFTSDGLNHFVYSLYW